MARLRYRNSWFDEVNSTSFYETEFESVLLQNADLLVPGAHLVPFKQAISDYNQTSNCPDLALIDPAYRFWWVIEVELTSHSLRGHVLPQVRTFVEGRYGPEHVRALLRYGPALDERRLREMLRGDPPEIVVIADRFLDEWQRELRKVGVHYAVFNLFRSPENLDIMYFDGSLPSLNAHHISRAIPIGITRMLRLLSPAAVPGENGSTLQVFFHGRPTMWTRVDTDNLTFLTLRDPLEIGKARSYVLESDGERLVLREEG
jgi:hypothetical protein